MNELFVLKNMELIKITTQNNQQSVSARELYEFLEIKDHFTQWIQRMFAYGFKELVDYQAIKIFLNASNGIGGTNKTDYLLTLDTAKEISMIQRTEKGKEARSYFIECEKQLRTLSVLPDFTNPSIAARAWADQYEAKLLAVERAEKAEAKVIEFTPKVEHYEAVMNAEGEYDMAQVAQMLGTGRNRLFEFLREQEIFYLRYGENRVYQELVDEGWFRVVQSGFQKGMKYETYGKIMVTPKGVEKVRKLWENKGVKQLTTAGGFLTRSKAVA